MNIPSACSTPRAALSEGRAWGPFRSWSHFRPWSPFLPRPPWTRASLRCAVGGAPVKEGVCASHADMGRDQNTCKGLVT